MFDCNHNQIGKESDWPALAAMRPDQFLDFINELPPEDIMANDDFCIIKHDDQTDYFIRVVCKQKILGCTKHYEYGPWVSVSKKNFYKYRELLNEDSTELLGIGYWCTNIPWYPDMHSIPCKIYLNGKSMRPIIEPIAEYEHPFVNEFYSGIEYDLVNGRYEWFVQTRINAMKDINKKKK